MDTYTLYALLVCGAFVVWLSRDRRREVSAPPISFSAVRNAHIEAIWQLPGIPSIGPDNWLLSWLTVIRAKTQGIEYMKEGYEKVRRHPNYLPNPRPVC